MNIYHKKMRSKFKSKVAKASPIKSKIFLGDETDTTGKKRISMEHSNCEDDHDGSDTISPPYKNSAIYKYLSEYPKGKIELLKARIMKILGLHSNSRKGLKACKYSKSWVNMDQNIYKI